MTHTLVVAYHFPPIGGAGAQRPARLVGHLMNEGLSSTVITGSGPSAGRWTPEDQALGSQIPGGVDVLRVPGPEPTETSLHRARLRRWLMQPSPWATWWIDGVARAGRAV